MTSPEKPAALRPTDPTSVLRKLDNAQDATPLGGVGSAGVLSIDVEAARAVVGRLEAVALQVLDLHMALGPGVAIQPPGNDAVSRNAAQQSVKMMVAARAYLARWHDDLTQTVVALEQQIAGYEQADRLTTARL